MSTSDAGPPPDSPTPAPAEDGNDAATVTAPVLGDADVTLPEPNDPFLAPNAVVAAPQRETPTTVYRPDNIGTRITDTDTAAAAERGAPTTAVEAEPASGPGQATPRPTPQSAPGTTAGDDADITQVPEVAPDGSPSPEPGEPATAAPDATDPAPAPATSASPATPAPEGQEPELDATDEAVDSPTNSPAADTPASQEPTEPTPAATPQVGEPAPGTDPAPAETPAPAPVEQNVPAKTPGSGPPGSGSPWSWSTVRNWLPW